MPADSGPIRDASLWLYGIELAPVRAAELAAEVETLNEAVRKQADARLGFDSDPAAFAASLSRSSR